ncbi:hypothetical protein U1Q18_049896 [Sarracenia purpurea var. burkii]
MNDEMLRGHVINQLNKMLRKEKFDRRFDYGRNLVNFLDENKSNPGVEKVFHQIRQCADVSLHVILDKFLKENGIEEKEFQDDYDNSTWRTLIDIIIDELIFNFGVPYESELDVFLASDEELIREYRNCQIKRRRRRV